MKLVKIMGSLIFLFSVFITVLFIDLKLTKAFNQNICPNFKITATGGYNRTDAPTLEMSTYNNPYSFPVAKPAALGQGSPVVTFKATPTRSFSGTSQITLMRYDYRALSHGGNGTKTVDYSFFRYGETSLYTAGDFNYGSISYPEYGYLDPVYDTGRSGNTWTDLFQVIPDMVAYRAIITYPDYSTCESDLVYVKMSAYNFPTAELTYNEQKEAILNYSLSYGGNYATSPPVFRKGNGGRVAVMIYDAYYYTGDWFAPLWQGNSNWFSKDRNIGVFWGKSTPEGLPSSGTINLGKFYQNINSNTKIALIAMADPIAWTTGETPDTECPWPFKYSMNPNYCYTVAGYQELEPFLLPPAYKLDVSISGTGSGTVTSNPPGINCSGSGTDCTENYQSGEVTLTAAPNTGSNFTGWSGACTGTGSCIVTMSANRSVTANFDLIPQVKPFVETRSYDKISSTSVKIYGLVNDFGSSPGVDRGFYVSADSTCDTNDTKYSVPPVGSTGDMNYTINGWTQGSGYYMAFAKNQNTINNVDFGSCSLFETLPPTTNPTVTTNNASNPTQNSVTGNGNITNTGGATITTRGFIYDTSVALCNSATTGSTNKVQELGSFGTGAYTNSITSLSPNTEYWYKAFAINLDNKIGYGNCLTFKTSNIIITTTTSGLSVTVTWQENGETKQVNLKTDLIK